MDTNSLISSDSSIGIDAMSIAAFVRDGGHVAVLTGPARPDLAAVLDRALSDLQGQVIRIGNALASPLTLGRILFQVGAVSDGEADPVALIRGALAEEGGADPALLVIEDAQTLEPEALAMLASLPHGAEDGRPGLAVILAGPPELLRMLSAPGLASLWEPMTRMTLRTAGTSDLDPVPVPAEARDDLPPSMAAEPPVAPRLAVPMPPPVRRRSPARVFAAAAVAGLVVTVVLLAVSAEQTTSDQLRAAVAPLSAEPEPQAAKPAAAPDEPQAEPEPPSEPSPEQLRRDFDAFLNRAGQDTASLTPDSREALFQQYLAWRARAKVDRSASPSAAAVPAARTP